MDREGRRFDMPFPTHGVEAQKGLAPFITSWDAIGELRPPPEEDLEVRGRWAQLLPSIPEGWNYLWYIHRGGALALFGYRARYWSFLLKLAKARPSWTLPAHPSQNSGPCHWNNRLLSVAELARLRSFPIHWRFMGRRADKVRQVGNALPLLLAELIGWEIAHQLGAIKNDRAS